LISCVARISSFTFALFRAASRVWFCSGVVGSVCIVHLPCSSFLYCPRCPLGPGVRLCQVPSGVRMTHVLPMMPVAALLPAPVIQISVVPVGLVARFLPAKVRMLLSCVASYDPYFVIRMLLVPLWWLVPSSPFCFGRGWSVNKKRGSGCPPPIPPQDYSSSSGFTSISTWIVARHVNLPLPWSTIGPS